MARINSTLHESLTDDVLSSLFSKKIYTTIDFIDSETKFVSKTTGLSYKEIIEIQKAIKNKYACEIVTGAELYEDFLKFAAILPTNIKSLDQLLGGGLTTGNIYELCGYAGTGKTQMCFTICLNIVQDLKNDVLYIDTKRDFSAKRLQNMMEARKIPEDVSARILNQIKVYQISDHFELINTLYSIKHDLSTERIETKLIIIDSLPAVYYCSGDFNTTLTHMNHFTNIIRYLMIKHNLCILITNIMLKNLLNTNETGFSNTNRVGLGQYWLNVPHVRFNIRKTDAENDSDISSNCCLLTVLKSTSHKLNSVCTVRIKDVGCVS